MREMQAGFLEIAAEKLEKISDHSYVLQEERDTKRRKALELRIRAYNIRNPSYFNNT